MYEYTGEEKTVIDGVIDYWEKAGVPLSGVNWENPVVMQGLGRFFKKIGKGIKNVARKIKERIRERNIQANIQSDSGQYSLGPQGISVKTPEMSLVTDKAGARGYYEPSGRIKEEGGNVSITPTPTQPNFLLIGGVAVAALAIMMMAKK